MDLLQLAGMTFRARGRRSSKDASSTTAWSSGYDITAQLAVIGQTREQEVGGEVMRKGNEEKITFDVRKYD